MSIEAMKQALEALKNNKRTHHYCEDTWYSCPKHEDGCANEAEGDECNCGADEANAEIDKVITALRQAIEQAQKQETVAWGVDWSKDGSCVSIIKRLPDGGIEVLACEYAPYISPPPRQPLTDEEIVKMAEANLHAFSQYIDGGEAHYEGEIDFARAIEAAHGIFANAQNKGEA